MDNLSTNTNNVITDPSLPHQREILALVELVNEAYKDDNFVGVVITDHMQHGRWLIQKLHDSVRWDQASGVKLFREGIEVKGGGRITVASVSDPSRLRGISATKILVFGQVGELLYLLRACVSDMNDVIAIA